MNISSGENKESDGFYYNRGIEKYDAGDYYGAISNFSKAIEINPRNPEAYNNRGNVKVKLEDYEGAKSDYTKAIRINPRYADAYYNRATTKGRDLRDYYGAISDFNKAIEINPRDVSAYANRGLAKMFIGDMKGACSDWRKASSLGHQKSASRVRSDCN